MRAVLFAVSALVACLVTAAGAIAQPPRTDVIWARSTLGAPITPDGILDEPAWAVADSIRIQYGVSAGIPGSGWKAEAGILPSDPTDATLKLLVVGNRLYLAAVVKDKSIGGSADFNRHDGLLMAIKDHVSVTRPRPPQEYLYSWWYPAPCANPLAVGNPPLYKGVWAADPPCDPRTDTQIDNWFATTVIDGTTNDDAVNDVGYTIEMMFNLTPMGYDVTQEGGDIVEWNVSIYDCDWNRPNIPQFSANRVWWQGPWGNAPGYNEVRIHSRPDVTIASGPAPVVPPELIIPGSGPHAAPVVDGSLSEAVWQYAPGFQLIYGDETLPLSLPSVGPHRVGYHQPSVNGGQAAILDPGNCTVKYFYKDDMLYLGFDVIDGAVQFQAAEDRWDGFRVSINERALIDPQDHVIQGRRLSFQVSGAGAALAQDYLPNLIGAGDAQVALQLKPNSTVDNVGFPPDEGYTAELAIDLTALGYPVGRGDGVVFLGVCMFDGDTFAVPEDSYGTRAWWFREYDNTCGPVWAYMDPGANVVAVGDDPATRPAEFATLGNYPNPFRDATTLRFSLSHPSEVLLEIIDVQGRLVTSRSAGRFDAGVRQTPLRAVDWPAGLYFYRLRMVDPDSGELRATLSGRLLRVP